MEQVGVHTQVQRRPHVRRARSTVDPYLLEDIAFTRAEIRHWRGDPCERARTPRRRRVRPSADARHAAPGR